MFQAFCTSRHSASNAGLDHLADEIFKCKRKTVRAQEGTCYCPLVVFFKSAVRGKDNVLVWKRDDSLAWTGLTL